MNQQSTDTLQQAIKQPAQSNDQLTVSIVSHGHGPQVATLVRQVLDDTSVTRLILTLNVPETLELADDHRLLVIRNSVPKGFGANHNQAFSHCDTPYYCVLNPDVVLRPGALSQLVECLRKSNAAVAGPLVLSGNGAQEDSWRRFPTVKNLFLKLIGRDSSTILRAQDEQQQTQPDWVAGMCMLFRSESYKLVGGFDEKYFMYYEDVDICKRLCQQKSNVAVSTKAVIIHNAQRASHRQLRHLVWHASSMIRYLLRHKGSTSS